MTTNKKELKIKNYPSIEDKNTKAIQLNLQMGKVQDDGATPWFTELELGTPKTGTEKQIMRIMIDTGTSHSWVTTTWCKNVEASPPLRRQFNPDNSTTYQEVKNDLTAISFGPWGTLYAKIEEDVVNFPLNQTQSFQAMDFKFYFAKSYFGYKFEVLDYDGFFAIPPFPVANENNQDSQQIVQRAYEDKLIETRIASFNYDTESKTGECIIGAIDPSKFNKETSNVIPLKYALMYPNSWGVQLEDFLYDNKSLIEIPYYTFILDTGASLFKGDPAFIQKISNTITNNQDLPETFTAENYDKYISKYSDINIVLNGVKYLFEPKDYFMYCEDRKMWRLAFENMDGFDGILLVGSVFLNKYYTIFDIDNKCVVISNKI